MDKRKYVDRAKYIIRAVQKRRKKIREMAINYKGAKCELCGYNKALSALEFHHLNTSEKDFGISDKGYTRSWKKVRQEIDKCILICANCHRELHEDIKQLPRVIVVEKRGELREP